MGRTKKRRHLSLDQKLAILQATETPSRGDLYESSARIAKRFKVSTAAVYRVRRSHKTILDLARENASDSNVLEYLENREFSKRRIMRTRRSKLAKKQAESGETVNTEESPISTDRPSLPSDGSKVVKCPNCRHCFALNQAEILEPVKVEVPVLPMIEKFVAPEIIHIVQSFDASVPDDQFIDVETVGDPVPSTSYLMPSTSSMPSTSKTSTPSSIASATSPLPNYYITSSQWNFRCKLPTICAD